MAAVLKFAGETIVKDGVRLVVLSNEAKDRDGDIVRASGWDLTNFTKAPRLMSCHDYGQLTSQIGEWRNVHVDPVLKALVGEPHYYVGQGNAEADWGAYLASIGQATYSVGFAPVESQPLKGGAGYDFTRQELLECSHVPIPSNPEALQLMAKAFRLRQRGAQPESRIVQKWDSNFMPDSDPGGWGPADVHCIVAGCDDASQTQIPICSEHLKYLMNAAPEPPGSPPDDDDPMLRSIQRSLRRMTKAGRTMSAGNLGKLHSAMQALGDVHDSACTADDCPLDDDGDEDPPTSRDKGPRRRAMSEGDGSAGGVTVSDSGTHGAFGTADKPKSHSHDHADPGGDPGDLHDHKHEHAGDGDHGHAHGTSKAMTLDTIREAVRAELEAKSHSELPDSAFAYIAPGGSKGDDGKTHPLSLRHYPHHTASGAIDKDLLRAALSRLGDSSNEQGGKAHIESHAKDEGIGDDNKTAGKGYDLSAALDGVLAGVEW